MSPRSHKVIDAAGVQATKAGSPVAGSDLACPPGFWRRIAIFPRPGEVLAGLEDDVHRFRVTLSHDGSVVTGVRAWTDRFPYTTCSGAGAFLEAKVIGRRLDELARLDPRVNCTHLYDLALIAARFAGASEPKIFDIQVADRVEGRTRATLRGNGALIDTWAVEGTLITEPAELAGRDLRELSRWSKQFSEEFAFHARLLRRGIQVSGVRRAPAIARAADRGAHRAGACYTYQPGTMEMAYATAGGLIDFSKGGKQPLEGFRGEEGQW